MLITLILIRDYANQRFLTKLLIIEATYRKKKVILYAISIVLKPDLMHWTYSDGIKRRFTWNHRDVLF